MVPCRRAPQAAKRSTALRTALRTALPLAALTLLVVAGEGARADDPRRTQWEYRCIDEPRAEDLQPVLDKWGEDGWELAARVQPKLCFKRPRLVPLAALRSCKPACGAADRCVDGQCVPCTPACRGDEQCAPSGQCVPGRGETASAGEGMHWQPTREEFAAARATLQPVVDRCGAEAREEGQAVIALTVLGNGTVTSTKAGQSGLSAPTLRCLEEAARALRFRPFRAALISVDMPVVVKGRSATAAASSPAPSRSPSPSRAATPPAPSKLSD